MLFLTVERFLFVDCDDVKSHYPRLDLPGKEFKPLNRQVKHNLRTFDWIHISCYKAIFLFSSFTG